MSDTTAQHVLAYDLSNIAYINAYLLPKGFELRPDSADMLVTNIMDYAKRLYRKFQPDQVIFACDSPPYWRQEVFPNYKAHRPNNEIRRCVQDAVAILQTERPQYCCTVASCEADDILYGLKQVTTGQLTLVSMDGDFCQLIDDRVRLYNPRAKRYIKATSLPGFELFVKHMRGDRTDNIPSAYPHISRKRLWKAFNDEADMAQLMEVKLNSDDAPISKQYQLNRQLMDLSQMPEGLYQQIETSLENLLN